MDKFNPVYKFNGDSVSVLHGKTVIASGKISEIKKVESDALAYLEGLEREELEKTRKAATHVITPNGVKGKILNRTNDVWGEQISVRLNNGQTATYHTAGVELKWTTEMEKVASHSNTLEERLGASFNSDRKSLVSRFNELTNIKKEAARIINSGVSYVDEQKLDNIRVIADAEQYGLEEAIDAIDNAEVEAYVPPQSQVVTQSDLGNQTAGDWLSVMVDDMVAETEGNDLDAELDEGPELLAAELDDAVVNDQEVAREVALSHIIAKTAGYEGEGIERYRDSFLARFEQARRRSASSRMTKVRKEAATTQKRVIDAPDAALFG